MSGPEPPPPPVATRTSQFGQLIAICDAFETDWRAGRQPRIEHVLETVSVAERSALLYELLALERELRARAGDTPDRQEYRDRFPEQTAEVDAAFATPLPSITAGESGIPALPGYEILDELGRGGMGVVYKARQLGLNRTVALKMILAGEMANAQVQARFAVEAEAIARLQHPNIVQIHEIGQLEGRPYLTLEFVAGGSLAQRLDGQPQPLRQAAELIEALARAIHAAHLCGVVHRDLKPANVLLTVEGTPKIADFGLAKLLAGPEAERTLTGVILGTPFYMAPEQAEGRAGVGPPCDIHALGAILYLLLTGRPPYRGEGLLETLCQVREMEPEPPSRLRPKLPRDLETICLKCLRKDPGDRYATAEDLAEDLRAFLAGEPIRARPPGAGERLIRWARRHPALVILMAIIAASAGGVLASPWRQGALAVGGLAALILLAGASWYGARLRAALDQLAREHTAAARYVERLHLLLEMTRRMMDAPDRETLLRLIGETAARLANADRATIYLVDRDRREVWSRVATGAEVREIRLPLGVGVAGTVALTGQSVIIPNAYADARFHPDVDRQTGYRTRNLLTLPVPDRRGEVVGVFQILNKRQGDFTVEDETILQALAASAAAALDASHRAAGAPWDVETIADPDPTPGPGSSS